VLRLVGGALLLQSGCELTLPFDFGVDVAEPLSGKFSTAGVSLSLSEGVSSVVERFDVEQDLTQHDVCLVGPVEATLADAVSCGLCRFVPLFEIDVGLGEDDVER